MGLKSSEAALQTASAVLTLLQTQKTGGVGVVKFDRGYAGYSQCP